MLLSAAGVEPNGLQGKIGFEVLKATVPEALASVSNVSIRRFYRLELHAIDAYSTSMQYGAEEFKQIVYNRIAR